jgi:hypothetical protein
MAKHRDDIVTRINLIILERMHADPNHFGIEIQDGEEPIRTLKNEKPDFYLDMFNDIFDELHPY